MTFEEFAEVHPGDVVRIDGTDYVVESIKKVQASKGEDYVKISHSNKEKAGREV